MPQICQKKPETIRRTPDIFPLELLRRNVESRLSGSQQNSNVSGDTRPILRSSNRQALPVLSDSHHLLAGASVKRVGRRIHPLHLVENDTLVRERVFHVLELIVPAFLLHHLRDVHTQDADTRLTTPSQVTCFEGLLVLLMPYQAPVNMSTFTKYRIQCSKRCVHSPIVWRVRATLELEPIEEREQYETTL